ncbi:glycoside hydrolase family 55 protein [Inquilinus limosus]|uniref:hypothetical protein n=1 Tax=Inquilinus limosus TaxID=171674 RepID=UPI003F15DFA3
MTSVYDTRAQAQGLTVPAADKTLIVNGYSAAGDGGAAVYKRLDLAPSPARLWHFQSGGGAWWELAEETVNPRMIGARGDGISDDTPYIQALLNWKGRVYLPAGLYRTTDTLMMPFQGQMLYGPQPAERLPSMTPPMIPSTSHAVIMVDGNFDGIQSGNGQGYSQVIENLHVVSTHRKLDNTAVGINWGHANFNGANDGRKGKIRGVAVWYFQTGVRIGNEHLTDTSSWAWHLSDVKVWNCQTGFELNGLYKEGYLAQSLMDGCTALQLVGSDQNWYGTSSFGVKQRGGNVAYINPRFSFNRVNFFLDTGEAVMFKPDLEGAVQAVLSISPQSRFICYGGTSTHSLGAFSPNMWLLVNPSQAPGEREYVGDIRILDHQYTDTLWAFGNPPNIEAHTGRTLTNFCSIRERANVYVENMNIRDPFTVTPDVIFDSGTGKFTPRLFSLVGTDLTNYYVPCKFVPTRRDLDGSAATRMVKVGIDDTAVPGWGQKRRYTLDPGSELVSEGQYNAFANIAGIANTQGTILIQGGGRFNGSDVGMLINQAWDYRVNASGVAVVTRAPSPVGGNTAETGVTGAAGGLVVRCRANFNNIVLEAYKSGDTHYSLEVTNISNLNVMV